MGKEIPGSWFESGDTEHRTWDEMGLGEELHADDDDYIDGGITDVPHPRWWETLEKVTGPERICQHDA